MAIAYPEVGKEFSKHLICLDDYYVCACVCGSSTLSGSGRMGEYKHMHARLYYGAA